MTQAKRKNSAYAGYHAFVDDEGNNYGSFRVFWFDGERYAEDDVWADDDGETLPRGWYWWACFPGCIPDSETPMGPFTSSRLAWRDAREA